MGVYLNVSTDGNSFELDINGLSGIQGGVNTVFVEYDLLNKKVAIERFNGNPILAPTLYSDIIANGSAFTSFEGAKTFFASNFFLEASGGGGGYTLPVATSSVLGGVKQGSGVTIAGDGTLSTSGGGGGITAVTSIGTHETPTISGSTLNIPNMFGAVWQKFGTVLTPDFMSDQFGVYESTVIYEGSPQILTNASGSVFKMWFTAGTGPLTINYAESLDGLSWVRQSTPVVSSHCRSSVVKVGSTYYMYAVSTSGFNSIDRYTSSNGISWTLATSGVITVGGSGTWNHNSLANSSVYYDGTTWQMLLEANAIGGTVFNIGYYSSLDGITWTQFGSNPVLGSGSLNAGGPYLTKQGSTWYCWYHGGLNSLIPTNIYSAHSSNLTSWTIDNGGNPVINRTTAIEGVGTSTGQVADPTLVEVNGKTFIYYSADQDGGALSQAKPSVINVAIANYTLANLVNTTQGDGFALNVAQQMAYNQATSDSRFINNAVNNGGVYTVGGILLTTDFGGVGNGTGFRIRDVSTPANTTIITPDVIYLNKSGVTNTISGNSSDMTFSAWGGMVFANGSGSGASILGSFDNTGLLTVAGGLTIQGGAFNYAADAFAAALTSAITLRNESSASAGTPSRWSPSIYFNGTAWDTGSSSSKRMFFSQVLRPISGNPASYEFVWIGDNNFAGDVDLMKLDEFGGLQLINYTVATLPAAGKKGRRLNVTDALAPTFLGALTGGGTIACPVFDNGTAWVAG